MPLCATIVSVVCFGACYVTCRHLAATITSGIYWRLGQHCFKQVDRSDGLSVFFFYVDEEWWVTTNPNVPGFPSTWLALARLPAGAARSRLDLLEWHCPIWEDEKQSGMWVKSIHTSWEEQRQQHYADSITLRQQLDAALRIKHEELDR